MPAELKKTYETKEAIPESALGLYEEHGGKWIFSATIEGFSPSERVAEFRDKNTKLTQDLEKFDGIDPEQAREALKIKKQVDDGELSTKGDVQKRVEQRVEEFRKESEKEAAKKDAKIDVLNSRLKKALIDSEVLKAAGPLGLLKGAEVALLKMAEGVFTLDEKGDVIALQEDGKSPKYNKLDQPFSPKDFVESLANEKAKFLFEPNRGGGGDNQSRGEGGGSRDNDEINPWDPKTLNMTEQGRMVNTNPDKATRFAKKFGVELHLAPAAAKK